jgi:hypothetical protein
MVAASSIVSCRLHYLNTVDKARTLFRLAPGTPGLDKWCGIISRKGAEFEQLVLMPVAAASEVATPGQLEIVASQRVLEQCEEQFEYFSQLLAMSIGK